MLRDVDGGVVCWPWDEVRSPWARQDGPGNHRAAIFWLVRLSVLVWAPRGIIGPGFGLPWPAGGQVGWPSRWQHLGRPDGRSAACRRRRHVRFRPPPPAGCLGGEKFQGGSFGETWCACGAGSAPFFGAKNGKGTPLRVDLEQVSFGSLLGEEGRL